MPHALSARLARLERARAAAARGCDECRHGVGLAVVWARQHGPDDAPTARRCDACGRTGLPVTIRLVGDPGPRAGREQGNPLR